MANNVTPPFTNRIPTKWVQDPELNAFLNMQQRILHELWIRSGGDQDKIDEVVDVTLGSDDIPQYALNVLTTDPVTIDTTGFTIDTTQQTTDQTTT